MDAPSIPLKRCTKCRQEFPATLEYFYKHSKSKSRLHPWCKSCVKRLKPREVLPSGTKRCPSCKGLFSASSEFFVRDNTRSDGLGTYCKTCSRAKERQHRNPEKARRWRKEHPAEMLKFNQRWRSKNAESVRASGRKNANKRRAYKVNAGGDYTNQEIQEQYERQNGRCYYAACGHVKLGGIYHVEHVIPLSRGGRNDISNIVLTCPRCNLSKKDKLPHEWPDGGRLL